MTRRGGRGSPLGPPGLIVVFAGVASLTVSLVGCHAAPSAVAGPRPEARGPGRGVLPGASARLVPAHAALIDEVAATRDDAWVHWVHGEVAGPEPSSAPGWPIERDQTALQPEERAFLLRHRSTWSESGVRLSRALAAPTCHARTHPGSPVTLARLADRALAVGLLDADLAPEHSLALAHLLFETSARLADCEGRLLELAVAALVHQRARDLAWWLVQGRHLDVADLEVLAVRLQKTRPTGRQLRAALRAEAAENEILIREAALSLSQPDAEGRVLFSLDDTLQVLKDLVGRVEAATEEDDAAWDGPLLDEVKQLNPNDVKEALRELGGFAGRVDALSPRHQRALLSAPNPFGRRMVEASMVATITMASRLYKDLKLADTEAEVFSASARLLRDEGAELGLDAWLEEIQLRDDVVYSFGPDGRDDAGRAGLDIALRLPPPPGAAEVKSVEGNPPACLVGGEPLFRILQRDVDRLLEDRAGTAGSLRIVPAFEAGTAIGFKLFSIRPDSLLARCGLHNGDILLRINGWSLTSPDRAIDIFQSLEGERHIEVTLRRRGQLALQRYEIVDEAPSGWTPSEAFEERSVALGALPPERAPDGEAALVVPSQPSRPAPDVGCRLDEQGQRHLRRAALLAFLDSIEDHGLGASVAPAVQGGERIGYQLHRVRPGSVWSRCGVQDGDLVLAVDELEMTSTSAVKELVRRLRSGERSRLVWHISRLGRVEQIVLIVDDDEPAAAP